MKQEQGDEELKREDTAAPRSPRGNEKEADSQQSAYDFHPIKISGEPLSAVIIRERRERNF
jgi:hypothetical protein